ncbi:MAG: hypothetical protein DWH91_02840 [Planctomycetota bacterium]|nr:MAG: hypothetical protein DWH91_02840 [Planctomycetota bacterium]
MSEARLRRVRIWVILAGVMFAYRASSDWLETWPERSSSWQWMANAMRRLMRGIFPLGVSGAGPGRRCWRPSWRRVVWNSRVMVIGMFIWRSPG